MTEFRIYHVTRKVAKHNYELDDKLYGSPMLKTEIDWPLENPELYLQKVDEELKKVNGAIDDMVYLIGEKNKKKVNTEIEDIPKFMVKYLGVENRDEFSEEEIAWADAYAYHKFHVRQFEYVEKLSQQLQSKAPEEIELIMPKALRQLNVLLAARTDLTATWIRFTQYAKSVRK